MKQVHLRLEDNQYKEIAEYAKGAGMTVQDAISTALYVMLSRQKKQKKNRKFTFIDLFAGIGGMRLAFDEAGGECVYSNEWNKFSQQTYMANFGDMPDGDITQVNAAGYT